MRQRGWFGALLATLWLGATLLAASGEDFEKARSAANAEAVTQFFELADWCKDEKLYGRRYDTLNSILVLAPDDEAARKELGLTADQCTMIGDTMETDILGGVQMGYRTVLALSGGTSREDLAKYAYRPDIVVESVFDLCESPKRLDELVPSMDRSDDSTQHTHQWHLAQ